MSTLLLTLPVTSFAPGTAGPFVSVPLPAGTTHYQFSCTKGATWPATGNVLTYTVEISRDGGQTWQFDGSVTLAPGPWYERDGETETTAGATRVSIDAPGALLRGALTAHQACEIGVTLEALP